MGYQKVVIESAANTVAQNTTGSAATLTTERAIALSGGDVTGTANFNGSADIAINATIGGKVVETSMINDDAVTAGQIADGVIVNGHLANTTIDLRKMLLSGTYTAGKTIVAGASEGSIAYGSAVENKTMTVNAGSGLSGGGSFTGNQSSDSQFSLAVDLSEFSLFTGADNDNTIQSGDSFGVYDTSASGHRRITMEHLADKLAAGSNDGLTASAGQLTVDLSTLTAMTDPHHTDDYIVIIDNGVTKKMQPTRLAEKYAGTGLTNNNAVISVNTTQNINTITGQTSLSLASNTSVTGDLTISGDLTVSGQTITTATETLEIADNLIHLNSDLGSSAGVDTGIVAERGSTGDNACLFWDHSKSAWCIGTNSAVGFPSDSSRVMVNVEKDGAPTGTETTVGGMVYDTENNEMYVRTS
jgi:hypothetical protein